MVYAIAAKSGQKPTWNQLEHAIRRNFGGLEEGKPVRIFKQYFHFTEVSRTNPDVQSRDMSIRHFQYGYVCLHFTRASFNTVFGKSDFKITLIFSEMTPHFSYII